MATQPMGDPLTAAVLGPDVVAQQMRMQQAQEYAHALMQQGMQGPPQGRMVGNHYVAPSWTQGLASALQMYMGRRGLDDLPNQAAELGKLQADGYRRAFGLGGSPMAPDAAAPAAMAAGAANGDTGPTLTNANRMNSMVAGQPSSAPMYQSLPGRSPQDSMMTAMGIGMPEYQKLLAQQLAPSAEATRGRELGVDQPTQLANYLAAQKKAGYIPLTRLPPRG